MEASLRMHVVAVAFDHRAGKHDKTLELESLADHKGLTIGSNLLELPRQLFEVNLIIQGQYQSLYCEAVVSARESGPYLSHVPCDQSLRDRPGASSHEPGIRTAR